MYGGGGLSAPDDVMDVEGSVSSASSVSEVSEANLESYVDRKLQEQDTRLDSKLDSFAANFATFIRNEMCSLVTERPQTVSPLQGAPAIDNNVSVGKSAVDNNVVHKPVTTDSYINAHDNNDIHVTNSSLSAPRVVPLQPDPVVQPSTHRGNPHCGDERSEGDPYGRVLPGTLASPPP